MKKTIIFIIAIIICNHSFAQIQINGFDFISNLKDDVSVGKIDFYIKNIDPCSTNGEKNYFGIQSSVSNYGSSGFLNFKVQVVDCDGKILEQSISILLSRLESGFNENSVNWELAGKLFAPPYQIMISSAYNNPKLVQKGEVKLTDPDSLIINNNGKSIVTYGDEIIMEIAGGDNLINSTNSYWSWHVGSLNSKEIITKDKNYKFIPTSNTIVYVTAIKKTLSGIKKSNTVSKAIYVDAKSYEPNSISAENTTICATGNGTQLSVNGGKLGKMAKWVWYKNNCGDDGGEIIAKDVSQIDVRPTTTTTYFVRAEGDENYTNCKQITIEVVNPPNKPFIQVVGKSEICQGEVVNLILPRQPLNNNDNSRWEWFKKDFIENNSESVVEKLNLVGNAILSNPNKSSNFFVISQGGICNSVTSEYAKVIVKKKSFNVSIEDEQIQNKHKHILSANANYLGTNGKWIWYEGKYKNESDLSSSNFTKLNSQGNTFEVKAEKKENKYIFVSGQGDCDTPPIINGSITIPKYQREIEPKQKVIKEIDNSYSKNTRRNFSFKPLAPVKSQFILNVGRAITDDKDLITHSYTIGLIGYENSNTGSYFKYMRTDVNIYPTGDLVADNPTNTILNYPNDGTYYKFNNNNKSFNLQSYILGGMSTDFNQSVTVYGGYGYGEIKTIWGFDKYSRTTNRIVSSGFAKNNAKSYGGLALELGLMIRVWYFNINGGVTSVFGISEVRDSNIQPTTADPYADRIWDFQRFIKGHLGIGISILSRK
jgi:hypothetical protein